MATDFNSIVETIKAAQKRGEENPSADRPQVTVDQLGEIKVARGKPTDPAMSQVQHGTFAVTAAERTRRDLTVARTKMPPNTYYDDMPGAEGWYYSFVTRDLRNEYVMCASFDGVDYKVRLISPDLEAQGYAGHHGHLYGGGKLCLADRPGAGQPTLELAYSKSVLWAYGMDLVREGHPFPFQYGQ